MLSGSHRHSGLILDRSLTTLWLEGWSQRPVACAGPLLCVLSPQSFCAGSPPTFLLHSAPVSLLQGSVLWPLLLYYVPILWTLTTTNLPSATLVAAAFYFCVFLCLILFPLLNCVIHESEDFNLWQLTLQFLAHSGVSDWKIMQDFLKTENHCYIIIIILFLHQSLLKISCLPAFISMI